MVSNASRRMQHVMAGWACAHRRLLCTTQACIQACVLAVISSFRSLLTLPPLLLAAGAGTAAGVLLVSLTLLRTGGCSWAMLSLLLHRTSGRAGLRGADLAQLAIVMDCLICAAPLCRQQPSAAAEILRCLTSGPSPFACTPPAEAVSQKHSGRVSRVVAHLSLQ